MERDTFVAHNNPDTMNDFDMDWDQFDYEWAVIRNTTANDTEHSPNMDYMDLDNDHEGSQSTLLMNSSQQFNVDFGLGYFEDQIEASSEYLQPLLASPLTSWPGSTSTSSSAPTPQLSNSPPISTHTASPGTYTPVKIAPKPSLSPPMISQVHRYACPDCPSIFTRNCDLNRHARQHLRPITCPVPNCSERKATKRDMERHVKARHPKSTAAQPLLLASRFSSQSIQKPMMTNSPEHNRHVLEETEAPISTKVKARRDRPCDACRRRKNRCIKITGEPNLCVLCQARSSKCTFVQSPPPKKRRRIGDEGNSPNTVKPRSPADVAQNLNSPEAPLDYANIPSSSLLRETLGHQNQVSNEYLGASAQYDPVLLNLSRFNRKDVSVNTSGDDLRRVNLQTHFVMRSDTQHEAEEKMRYLDAVESIVAPHGQALIDIYFRIVHPSYPILHKKVMLEKYSRSYRELSPICLAAVYILALNWWSYSPNLIRLTKPSVQELEKLFPKMMADSYLRPRVSDIQGGLIYLQRPEGSSWSLIGQLVGMGQSLGLHIDCSDWRIPEWERALRKRLAWALFIQDKWGSLIHSRPQYIVQDNWDVRPVEKLDFPETAKDDDDQEGSSEVEKGMLMFVRLISLSEILADILSTFFTVKAIKKSKNTMEILELAKPLQLRLKTWHLELPSRLAIEETKARKLSSIGYLHLAYFATEVTLHRAILRSLDATNTDQQLKLITRNAAKMRFTSAVEFVKRLKPEHLQGFWFFASRVNLAIIGTFGSILWATSETNEECEFYRSQLAEYRWTLRVSSTAAEFMKYTVAMLDESPVFMTHEELEMPLRVNQALAHQTENLMSHESTGQGAIPNGISDHAFDFNSLSDDHYWLDHAVTGFESHTGNTGENMGTSTKSPLESWAYNFESITGGNTIPGIQQSRDIHSS